MEFSSANEIDFLVDGPSDPMPDNVMDMLETGGRISGTWFRLRFLTDPMALARQLRELAAWLEQAENTLSPVVVVRADID